MAGSETIFYFCKRAYLSDLPDRLKENAIASARKAAGEEFDVTALKNNETTLQVLLGQGIRSAY